MRLFIFILILAVGVLAGCGAEQPSSVEKTEQPITAVASSEEKKQEGTNQNHYPLEIKNGDRILTFTEAPKRVVTLNQHVTEVMLALGLEEYMVGTAYLDDEILPEYQEAYDKIPVLSDKYPSKEVFLSVEPDFAYAGWKSAFTEKNLGTVEDLEQLGINAYLHQSSSKVGPTIDDVYEDIRNIALIFNVEDRALKLIDKIKAELKKIQDQVGPIEKPLKVFVYDSGEDKAFTVAKNYTSSLISLAGGENIFSEIDKNWAEVNWEEVVNRNPDVIVIVDYGEMTAEQKKNILLKNTALASVPAIQNQRFVILPLSAAAEGVRAAQALEILAKGFYPEKFN